MLTFHSFRAPGLTYSRLHHRLPKSFNADAISSLHFFEIDMRRKPVFWTLGNYVTNSRIWNDFQISSHYMSSCRINKFGIFTISWLRSVCMNFEIRNKFIEIKYSVSNGLVFLYWPFQGGTSVVVPYCSCCLCLYFGSSIMLVTYFVNFR